MHSLKDRNGNTEAGIGESGNPIRQRIAPGVRRPDLTGRERGASILMFALLVPVLFGSVALAIDFGHLLFERQHLSNALDAAALAGVASLPNDPATAQSAALSYANSNDPGTVPTVKFWCVVGSTGATKTVASGQVPSVCDPGTVAGAKCNETICAIPCVAGSGHTCNSITVTGSMDVPFAFAPVIGINTGNTGSLSSNACHGSCGAQSPNPMNVAIVADRTGSMSDTDLSSLTSGIQSTLQTMTKDQQYVALGTIGRSSSTAPASCLTNPSASQTSGPWLPVPFSNDYTTAASPPALNGSSNLVKGLQCLVHSGTGTSLASPMKAAARYLLGFDANNLGSLPTRSGTPRNAIILETDGQPNEPDVTGSTSVAVPGDIGSSDGIKACSNLLAVAQDAKDRGILVITVGYNLATERCGGTGAYVRDVLAAAASKDPQGNPSTANACSTPAQIAAENSDGDYFFCAGSGTALGPIFVSAINAISGNSHLIQIPS
ncbi:pilus assembly protein TadG-related protein [Arthrobacter sp. 2MCAF14]|uniref:pilus assembly protein TadG-related protein n=1 Tax=Arthrobacter sp. 2MCAF14 TaxID=3232982 RepID=UPI003F90DEDA